MSDRRSRREFLEAGPGLCLVDGSVFPRSLGRNPSRTIAALAERVAAGILAEEGA